MPAVGQLCFLASCVLVGSGFHLVTLKEGKQKDFHSSFKPAYRSRKPNRSDQKCGITMHLFLEGRKV